MYKLEKPYTMDERVNFIVTYNHNQGLLIEETEDALYALEVNEIMQDGIPVINPNYEAEKAKEAKLIQIEKIKQELKLLDEQRIRALAEPSVKDELTGETWLEYYNAQAAKLRDELNSLEN